MKRTDVQFATGSGGTSTTGFGGFGATSTT